MGATKGEWLPIFDTDVHSLMVIQAAGRIWSGFAKADQVETTTIVNPNFRKRIMSLELFSTTTGKGTIYEKYLAKMNERAIGLGLIDKGNRILTMDDVIFLMNSKEYRETVDSFKAVGETLRLNGVPKGMSTGTELVEYAVSTIKAHPGKEQVTQIIDDDTLSVPL